MEGHRWHPAARCWGVASPAPQWWDLPPRPSAPPALPTGQGSLPPHNEHVPPVAMQLGKLQKRAASPAHHPGVQQRPGCRGLQELQL